MQPMQRPAIAGLSTLLIVLVMSVLAPSAHARDYVEGKDYEKVPSPQHTSVPAGKVEVLEVFSYACPACNHFQPTVERLKHDLPPNAQMTFMHASFMAAEDWPMFQRAYFTAQSLGVAERTHQAMYDAVWKTGELAIADPASGHLKSPPPSLEDAAQFYRKAAGVDPAKFLEASRSFGVEMKIRSVESQLQAMQVFSTPTIIVNGTYRVLVNPFGSYEDQIGVIRHLIAKESGR